jgi:predicted acylesterase/phospholipase RssA
MDPHREPAAGPGPSRREDMPPSGCELAAALDFERRHVDRLRAADEQAARHNPRGLPVGLALSGGGIRSATICLGAVQALAEKHVLRRFDYLSTVSGGGYTGSWLSAILRQRHVQDDPDPIGTVEELLSPRRIRERDEEPAEIAFLRAYSNYLTPRLGLFSADTLAALTGYLRNLLLSLLLAVLSTGLVLALVHGLATGMSLAIEHPDVREAMRTVVGLMLALGAMFAALLLTMQGLDMRTLIPQARDSPWLLAGLQEPQRTFANFMPTLVAGALLLAGILLEASLRFDVSWTDVAMATGAALVMFGSGALIAIEIVDWVGGARRSSDGRLTFRPKTSLRDWRRVVLRVARTNWREVLRFVFAAAGCALVLHQLLRVCAHLLPVAAPIALFRGPALAVGVAVAVAMVWLGAVGTTYAEPTREWLSRLLGTLVGVTMGWLVLGVIVINARPAMYWLASGQFLFAFQTAWILPTAAVLLLATTWMRRRPAADPASPSPGGRWTRLLVPAACGLVTLMFMSTMTIAFQEMLVHLDGTQTLIDATDGSYQNVLDAHLCDLQRTMRWNLLTPNPLPTASLWTRVDAWCSALWFASPTLSMGIACAIGTWVAFRYIDVNVFSLQNLYRNRLVRCYLGAARHGQRLQNPYAGFDPADDLELVSIAEQRPYHLMNTALNITQGEDLAWQQRQAASFCFSPLWCGYWLESANLSGLLAEQRPKGGYARTDEFAREPAWARQSAGVMMGTAMATSGAAVSSVMGFASHGLLAFVMTLFNVRLGRWFPNTAPRRDPGNYARHSPRFAGAWYLSELLGRTNEKSDWVYLSDGGHFDNLGVYELVRRRCRFIVVVDAGADPTMCFADLGNCVRKCRVDLGVNIRLDLCAFDLPAEARGGPPRPKVAHVAGKIYYPSSDTEPKCTGQILYIKSSLPTSLDETPADIVSFHTEHSQFPHQTTVDQWFTESQFESYRQLGYWITRHALPAVQAALSAIEHPSRGAAHEAPASSPPAPAPSPLPHAAPARRPKASGPAPDAPGVPEEFGG